MKRFLILWSTIFLCSNPLAAQFRLGADLMTMIDDNVNNNYLAISDKVVQVSLQMARDWERETHNTQLFYIGSLNYYETVTERTFHDHAFGMTYSHLLGQNQRTTLNTGISYSLRANRPDYNFYDHQKFTVYMNLKDDLAEHLLGRFGYSLSYLDFSNLSDFSYLEHYAFVQLTQSFDTKTTLILEGDLGTKIYTAANVEEVTVAGHGRRHNRNLSSTSTPRVTQFIGIARVGQAIVAGTGLSITAQYQINLQKASRYLTSQDGVIADDQLFDDHYGYEGLQATVMLTQLLPAGMVMKIAGAMNERNYTGQPAFDFTGAQLDDQRRDHRGSFALQVEKSFESLGVSFGLAYDYIHNDSNDTYYDYTNHAFTAQLSFGR